MKKVNIAQLKRDHKKAIDSALSENSSLRVRIVEVQTACQSLVDKWAMDRFEYERLLTKARDEINKLYAIRNAQ